MLTMYSTSWCGYCHRLKSMADQLADLGKPVRDRTLVLNVLRGLNDRFSYLDALIQRGRARFGGGGGEPGGCHL